MESKPTLFGNYYRYSGPVYNRAPQKYESKYTQRVPLDMGNKSKIYKIKPMRIVPTTESEIKSDDETEIYSQIYNFIETDHVGCEKDIDKNRCNMINALEYNYYNLADYRLWIVLSDNTSITIKDFNGNTNYLLRIFHDDKSNSLKIHEIDCLITDTHQDIYLVVSKKHQHLSPYTILKNVCCRDMPDYYKSLEQHLSPFMITLAL